MNNIRIYKNVELGKNVKIEDFVIIGMPPNGKEDGELKTVIGDNSIIRAGTIIYAGNKIGKNFNTGNGANIRELNEIGDNVSIGTKSVIEHRVKIEDNARIHSNCFVPEFSYLKKGCWLGPNVVLTNAMHPLCEYVKECLGGPVIGEEAIIGANATILPKLSIGKKSFIGAGSVVTKDVPEGIVVIGNPAKAVKKTSELDCVSGICDKPYKSHI